MTKISKYFTRAEIACKCGCGFDTMDAETLRIADAVREFVGKPVVCNSGCRCPEYNATEDVGGAKNSQHIFARAMDLRVDNTEEVYNWLCETYPQHSYGLYNTFVHVDTRTNGPARWDYR